MRLRRNVQTASAPQTGMSPTAVLETSLLQVSLVLRELGILDRTTQWEGDSFRGSRGVPNPPLTTDDYLPAFRSSFSTTPSLM